MIDKSENACVTLEIMTWENIKECLRLPNTEFLYPNGVWVRILMLFTLIILKSAVYFMRKSKKNWQKTTAFYSLHTEENVNSSINGETNYLKKVIVSFHKLQ